MKSAQIVFVLSLGLAAQSYAETCTYKTWEWDTKSKTSVHHRTVTKPKEQLTSEEKGSVPGCSVCEEDQTEVRVKELPKFWICKRFESQMVRAIQQAKDEGFLIHTIVGYRVGRSKGPVDSEGLRTQFSNHSFGTAIDFNSEINGLYDQCVVFGPQCKLLRGGAYIRDRAGSISPETSLYLAFREIGFKWGGEIPGKQKDFMHFSITGD